MSERGLPLGLGNTSQLPSRSVRAVWRISAARHESGTRCSRFAFMRSAGTVHASVSRSISSPPCQAYLPRARRSEHQELERQLGHGGRSRHPDRSHRLGDPCMRQRTHVSDHISLAPERCDDPVARVVGPVLHCHGPGAVLAFAITLSRAAGGVLTVDYATADGSAQAGVDYTRAIGTLTFQAGESSKTIEVGVLDDAHDEGEETLTLTLSNPSSGRLTDGEATGTIENRDPLPRALLARFGRAAAAHVVEHVEERPQAPREPGFRGRFAGQELRPGMEREMALNFLRRLGGGNPLGGGFHDPMAGGLGGAMGLGTPGLAGGGGLMPAPGGPLAGSTGFGGAGRMGAAPGFGGGASSFGMGGLGGLDPMASAAGPTGGLHGGGLLRMGLGGGDVLTGSAFALDRETSGTRSLRGAWSLQAFRRADRSWRRCRGS